MDAKPRIDTRRVNNRRKVVLKHWDSLRSEVARLVEFGRNGQVRTLGNWSLEQIIDHLSNLMEGSLTGFLFRAPLPLRWIGGMLKIVHFHGTAKMLVRPGFRLPRSAANLEPSPTVDLLAAHRRFERIMDRLARGESFCQPSPVLGKLSHEQWTYIHLRHAEMHLSFVVLGV